MTTCTGAVQSAAERASDLRGGVTGPDSPDCVHFDAHTVPALVRNTGQHTSVWWAGSALATSALTT